MHWSIQGVADAYGITGIFYALGSVYDGLATLTDPRKARGEFYASSGKAMQQGYSLLHTAHGAPAANLRVQSFALAFYQPLLSLHVLIWYII